MDFLRLVVELSVSLGDKRVFLCSILHFQSGNKTFHNLLSADTLCAVLPINLHGQAFGHILDITTDHQALIVGLSSLARSIGTLFHSLDEVIKISGVNPKLHHHILLQSTRLSQSKVVCHGVNAGIFHYWGSIVVATPLFT